MAESGGTRGLFQYCYNAAAYHPQESIVTVLRQRSPSARGFTPNDISHENIMEPPSSNSLNVYGEKGSGTKIILHAFSSNVIIALGCCLRNAIPFVLGYRTDWDMGLRPDPALALPQ